MSEVALPLKLNSLWKRMQAIRSNPNFNTTLNTAHVNQKTIEMYHLYINSPKSWLLDGRAQNILVAVAVVERLLKEYE